MSNDFYFDEDLVELFGKRHRGISIFEPQELGWLCPINKKHRITWSEFNRHIWCYDCKKDYFTVLCPKELNPFTTPTILKKETELVKDEMAKWTLKKYKNFHKRRRKDHV